MPPALLFLLAILTPLIIGVVLLLPIYAGIFASTYTIYSAAPGANTIGAHAMDVFYILDVYGTLFSNWEAHMEAVSVAYYTVPLLLLPAIGLCIAIYVTRKLTKALMNLFHIGASS